MSILKARCDAAGVKLKGDSQRYFHGGRCADRARDACTRAERRQRRSDDEKHQDDIDRILRGEPPIHHQPCGIRGCEFCEALERASNGRIA